MGSFQKLSYGTGGGEPGIIKKACLCGPFFLRRRRRQALAVIFAAGNLPPFEPTFAFLALSQTTHLSMKYIIMMIIFSAKCC